MWGAGCSFKEGGQSEPPGGAADMKEVELASRCLEGTYSTQREGPECPSQEYTWTVQGRKGG